jgi:hypothetical protein
MLPGSFASVAEAAFTLPHRSNTARDCPARGTAMKTRLALAAVLAVAAAASAAAPPAYITIDQSSPALIGNADALKIWAELIPAKRLARLYPPAKWGFASETEGGLNPAGLCVVTARAMMLPVSGKALRFAPARKSTTFDAQPGLSKEKCSELASAKLKEAVQSVLSGLVKP